LSDLAANPTKPVTITQIAKLAGVSKPVVSKVLHGGRSSTRVSDRTRKRVEKIARDTGYRPNSAARSIARRETRQIGVLVPNSPDNRFTHPLAYETILGINEGLQKAGYVVVMARIDDIRGDLADQSRVFKEQVLDGMIVLDSMPEDIEHRLEGLIPRCVWCDTNVWREHACLRRDEEAAGRLAGESAVAGGYERIRMMTYTKAHRVHFSAVERYRGVRRAVKDAGRDLSVITEPAIGDAAAREKVQRELTGDTVVICNSIYQAHAVRSIAEAAGKSPGRDFGLVCCDDQHQLDRMWPGLTRVSFDRYAMGVEAADMALCVMRGGVDACESKRLGVGLIAGVTCGRRAADGTTDPDSKL